MNVIHDKVTREQVASFKILKVIKEDSKGNVVQLRSLGAPLTVSLENSATTSGKTSCGQPTVAEVITIQLGAVLTDRQLCLILRKFQANTFF